MTEEQEAVAMVAVASEQELLSQLNTAIATGDFKAVARVGGELAKFQKTKEAAELTEKQAALATTTDKVKSAISKALKGMYESGELDLADGVWFGWDFGEKLTTCRLMKTTAKTVRATGGGGGGKKYPINTIAVIQDKYATTMYKESGMTFLQAYESNTDKNWRYAIREEVLKLEGLIS